LLNRNGKRYKPGPPRDYEAGMRKRLLPDFGGNPLSAITTAGLQALVSDMLGQGLSASKIRNTINPVRALYRDADLIGAAGVADPTQGLRLPVVRSKRPDERMPTPAQFTDSSRTRLTETAHCGRWRRMPVFGGESFVPCGVPTLILTAAWCAYDALGIAWKVPSTRSPTRVRVMCRSALCCVRFSSRTLRG
jgi:hypothetical protein